MQSMRTLTVVFAAALLLAGAAAAQELWRRGPGCYRGDGRTYRYPGGEHRRNRAVRSRGQTARHCRHLAGAIRAAPGPMKTFAPLDGDVLKAWYDAELRRLDREIRTIGKIESRT